MKLIIAIIRENQLDQVREALINAGISRITVNDDFKDITCNTILKATSANADGLIGSGKIFVLTLDEVVRLRTGETGTDAI